MSGTSATSASVVASFQSVVQKIFDAFRLTKGTRSKIPRLVFVCARRLHNAVQAKQKDKQAVGQLEKRLKAEQDARAAAEKQLADEKKRKKLEEARAVALAAASRYVNVEIIGNVFIRFVNAIQKVQRSDSCACSEGSAQTRCDGGSPN